MTGVLQAFWDRACISLALPPNTERPDAWSFGDSTEMADELLDLVISGKKTATAGALWQYQADGDPLPIPGQLFILLDGSATPRCVIETTSVEVIPFEQIGAAFAFSEGEGNRTLDWWRQAHESFFRRTLITLDRGFEPDMPIVAERFVLRYRPGQEPL